MQTALGILSGLVLIAGDIPYIRDTLRGRTKPHRTTWGIVLLLSCINVANQIAVGATTSLPYFLLGAFVVGIIFVLSWRRGTGGAQPLDIISLSGALLGLVLWHELKTPVASILTNLAVACLALAPTYKKAWFHPESETAVTWLASAVAALLAMAAVGELFTARMILPFSSFLLTGSLFAILRLRSKSASQHGPS